MMNFISSLTAATWADPLLAAHRRYVENHQLGFGDPAFHALLWLRLLESAARRFGHVRALEIGVFKGQGDLAVVRLVRRARGIDLEISALSPLAGQPLPRSRFWNRIPVSLRPAFPRTNLIMEIFMRKDGLRRNHSRLFPEFRNRF